MLSSYLPLVYVRSIDLDIKNNNNNTIHFRFGKRHNKNLFVFTLCPLILFYFMFPNITLMMMALQRIYLPINEECFAWCSMSTGWKIENLKLHFFSPIFWFWWGSDKSLRTWSRGWAPKRQGCLETTSGVTESKRIVNISKLTARQNEYLSPYCPVT